MTAPAGVFAAAGLPEAPDRALSVLTLIRALYAADANPPPEVRTLHEAIDQAWNEPDGEDRVELPLPFPYDIFESLMRELPPTPDRMFAALLRDRGAALLYYGAMAMDASTREFLATQPDLVRTLADDHAGIVAAFGRSLRVANNRIVVPGGDEAVPLWEEIVDARVTEPATFIRRLIESHDGRLAYMFDTIAHLDPPRQRFVLGLWMPNAGRIYRLRIVLRAFTDIDREWSFAASPFGRPRHDAVLLLRLVPVDARGAPTQPSWRGLWNAAFDGTGFPDDPRRSFRRVDRTGMIDAATLVEQILLTPPPVRRTRFETYAFGVRRFRDVSATTAPDAIVALRAFARYPAVMLGLERMGVTSPAVFVAVARACERVAEVTHPQRGHALLAQFQGTLAIVGRAARAGRIDPAQIEALVTSLAQVEVRDDRYAGRMAAWIEQTLIPAVRPREIVLPPEGGSHERPLHADAPAASGFSSKDDALVAPGFRPQKGALVASGFSRKDDADAETTILTAIADRSPDADGRRVELEGLSYAIDVTAGDVARFEQVRARQGGERLDDVLIAARELTAPGVARRARDMDSLDRRLADVLLAIVYAPHQGDPSELFPAAAALFRRHDFGLDRAGVTTEARRRAPWERPRIADTAGQTRVFGSLLGLDLALARFSLRRLVSDRLPPPPTLNQNDREAVQETTALLNPRDLTDARMHAIAAALSRGRQRIAAARDDAAALDRLAGIAGMGEARRQVLSWMASRAHGQVEQVFALAEVLRVGTQAAPGEESRDEADRNQAAPGEESRHEADRNPAPPTTARYLDGWGMSNEPLEGCYCLRFPDRAAWENFSGRPGAGQVAARLPGLALRLAELLTEMGIPAALMPATFAYAAQDFVDEAPAMHSDDGTALVLQARALTRVRVEDYLAAVAAQGPLRPIDKP